MKLQAVAASITKWAGVISSEQGKQKHIARFYSTDVEPHNLESKVTFK